MTYLSIEQIHKNKTGKVSDKWQSYLSFYDRLLNEYRTKKLNLMEIGVQNGGSLETWKTFFPNANVFIGCDIDERCGNLQYDDPRVNIVVGDANLPDTINKISTICSEFDIIIDDGSHQSTDILRSFLIYFPMVKPEGIFVIEDVHTLYQSQYGGGILNEFSAYNFFKKIIDVVSFQFWKDDLSMDVFFRTFFPAGQIPAFIKEGWIESIEFKNSLIVIRKSIAPTHDKLGARYITGDSAEVNDSVLKYRQNI